MPNSRRYAMMIGPTAILLGVSEMLNSHIWAAVTPPITFQAGTMLFVAGLSIVTGHNVWQPCWTVIVTLTGWLAVLLGAVRMLFPELAQQAVAASSIPLVTQLLVLVVGVFLTVMAKYGPEPPPLEASH